MKVYAIYAENLLGVFADIAHRPRHKMFLYAQALLRVHGLPNVAV